MFARCQLPWSRVEQAKRPDANTFLHVQGIACVESNAGRASHERIFGEASVDDGVLGKIAFAEALVLGPQPLGDLAHRRPLQKPSARLVSERVLDVARRQAPRMELHRQPLEFPRRPESAARTLQTNGSGVSRTCGAEYSTAPSAVLTLPVR
jgi:hypothetical protein